MKTIFELCQEKGIKCFNHESDLYIEKNKDTEALINEYEFKKNVKTFYNELDNKVYYDIPFSFDPYWINKHNQNKDFKLYSVETGLCCIYYKTKNKNNVVLLYCLMNDTGQEIDLYRCTLDGEPDHKANLKQGLKFVDLFQLPTGYSDLEVLVRDFIRNN